MYVVVSGGCHPHERASEEAEAQRHKARRSVALKAGCCCRGAHLELLRVLADEVADEGAAPLLVGRVLLRAMDCPTVEEQCVCAAYEWW